MVKVKDLRYFVLARFLRFAAVHRHSYWGDICSTGHQQKLLKQRLLAPRFAHTENRFGEPSFPLVSKLECLWKNSGKVRTLPECTVQNLEPGYRSCLQFGPEPAVFATLQSLRFIILGASETTYSRNSVKILRNTEMELSY